jgi:hypothetical protein
MNALLVSRLATVEVSPHPPGKTIGLPASVFPDERVEVVV